MNNERLKIIVSGGHLTPGLAVIDYAQKIGANVEFVWLGRLWAQAGSKQKAAEKKAVGQRGVRFIEFNSGKTSENKLIMGIKVGLAYCHAKRILKKEKPSLFLSFGGYLAVPIALAAHKLGIPIITHEQTRTLGKANALIAKYAQVLALSYKETPLPKVKIKAKIEITGNPIRESLFIPNDVPPLWWPGQTITKPIIYVSGGSQGSQAINQAFIEIVTELSNQFFIVHQVGPATSEFDWVTEYLKIAKQKKVNMNNYCCRPFLNELELRFLYPRINLAVARAGANSVAELASFAIPTIFIPLPIASKNEQQKNAEFYSKKGAAYLIIQSDLTPELLRSKILQLNKYQKQLREKLLKIDQKNNASQAIMRLIRSLTNEQLT